MWIRVVTLGGRRESRGSFVNLHCDFEPEKKVWKGFGFLRITSAVTTICYVSGPVSLRKTVVEPVTFKLLHDSQAQSNQAWQL